MATVRFETPSKKNRCKLDCHVVLLNNINFSAALEKKSAKGNELFERVCDKLRIPSKEREYFGLQFTDRADGDFNWLDLYKEIRSQLPKPYNFQFAVRIFPTGDYSKLSFETQYQVRFQVKNHLLRGKFVCQVKEHADLDGVFAQAMLGDFQHSVHTKGYLEDLLGPFFAPPNGINSETEVNVSQYELSVANNHRSCRGMSVEKANLAYLELAQKLAFFGTVFHPGATDVTGKSVLLALDSQGVLIYECDETQKPGEVINRFPWQDIVSFVSRKRKFYILAYSVKRKEGGSFSFRFHGHYAHRGADRVCEDAIKWQSFCFKPEKLDCRSKSLVEVHITEHLMGNQEIGHHLQRFGAVGKKRPTTSFKKFKSLIRKKFPRSFKSGKLNTDTAPNSDGASSTANPNATFESSITPREG